MVPIYKIKKGHETYTVEPYIEGRWEKSILNDGTVIGLGDTVQKHAALSHFSYVFTNSQAVILDVQGMYKMEKYVLGTHVSIFPIFLNIFFLKYERHNY